MPSGLKVTQELFTQIKNELAYSEPLTVAIKNHLSVKTILQIKGSVNFRNYEEITRKLHPEVRFSVKPILEEIDRKLDILIAASQQNRLL